MYKIYLHPTPVFCCLPLLHCIFCDNIPTEKFIFSFFGAVEGGGRLRGGGEGGGKYMYAYEYITHAWKLIETVRRTQIFRLANARRSQFAIVNISLWSLLKTVSNVFAEFTVHGFVGKISQCL